MKSMQFIETIIALVDSYKFTHYLGYPPGTEYVYLYMMARPDTETSKFERVVWFGLQYYLRKYLEDVTITHEMIDTLIPVISEYGYPKFNEKGWRYIVDKHGGKLPIEIKALPEGSYVERGNVLMTIVNTDPECYWLPSYLETLLLEIWYPCTVATYARKLKSLIAPLVEGKVDPYDINFKVHNFGARAGPAPEATRLAGMAHLTSFVGTDTFDAVYAARCFYDEENAGTSISAAEHSTIISWGKENEAAAYENMIDQFGDEGLFACVSDSYDYENAVDNLWMGELKDKLLNCNAKLVIRPDSGDPFQTTLYAVLSILKNLGEEIDTYGCRRSKGDKAGVILGDSVTPDVIKDVLTYLNEHKISPSMVNFGMGGKLVTGDMTRDTYGFTMKSSAVCKNGDWYDCQKTPKGSTFKKSLPGKFNVIKENGKYKTVPENMMLWNCLETVYLDGHIVRAQSLTDIRSQLESDVAQSSEYKKDEVAVRA